MENKLLDRKDVKIEDTWDLTLLYKNDEEFEKDFKSMEDFSKEVRKFCKSCYLYIRIIIS